MNFLTLKIYAIIAAIVLSALGGWAYSKHLQIEKLKDQVVEEKNLKDAAINQRNEAAGQRDKVIELNKLSERTIALMLQEKEDIERALSLLEDDKKKNQQTISSLSAKIRNQSNNPANKVELSPVLKMTVDEIQKQRLIRSGVMPAASAPAGGKK